MTATDPTTLTAVSLPLNGVIFVNNAVGVISYTPNAGFLGTDSFTSTVADNLGAISNAATVTETSRQRSFRMLR